MSEFIDINSDIFKQYLAGTPSVQSSQELDEVELEHMLVHMKANMFSNVTFLHDTQEPFSN